MISFCYKDLASEGKEGIYLHVIQKDYLTFDRKIKEGFKLIIYFKFNKT